MKIETVSNFLYVPMMDYGKVRREFIKGLFINNPAGMLGVNSKYKPQVKDDPDLKKLIKSGFLKQVRVKYGRNRSRTYLVLL